MNVNTRKALRLDEIATRVKGALRARLWQELHRNFLVIATWHQITESYDRTRQQASTWTKRELFEQQLDYLSDGFRIIPLAEAIERVSRGSLGGRFAVLTFDDGDASVEQVVTPILKKRNLPATFFINTAYLGKESTYWSPVLAYFDQCNPEGLPEGLLKQARDLRRTGDMAFYDRVRREIESKAGLVPDIGRRLVTHEWLASLDGDQFAIGNHGHEHERYAMMPVDWQRADLRKNTEILKEFRAYRPIFAVPFGRAWDWTQETIEVARSERLKVILSAGGITFGRDDIYDRIPCDSQPIREVIEDATAALPLF